MHWSDGGAVDLDRVATALRRQGAALLIDATHGAGVMRLDVRTLDPDFLVFPTYKWVLGPYGRAFLYVAKRRQDGVPLEQTSYGRRAVGAEHVPYIGDTRYVADARRFDMGERDHFISLEMASIGMEMVAEWGPDGDRRAARMLTDRLADGLRNSGVLVPDARVRAPHILSLGFPKRHAGGLVERLAAEQRLRRRRASAASASARTSTTTRRTWTVSSRRSARRRADVQTPRRWRARANGAAMSNLSPTPELIRCEGTSAAAPVREAYPVRTAELGGGLSVQRALPHHERRLVGPWCFLDHFGPMSFTGGKPMDVPPHPHIGLQTVTWIIAGEVLHKDSLGNEQLIRRGALNLMTAGNGIAHSEELHPAIRAVFMACNYGRPCPRTAARVPRRSTIIRHCLRPASALAAPSC